MPPTCCLVLPMLAHERLCIYNESFAGLPSKISNASSHAHTAYREISVAKVLLRSQVIEGSGHCQCAFYKTDSTYAQ